MTRRWGPWDSSLAAISYLSPSNILFYRTYAWTWARAQKKEEYTMNSKKCCMHVAQLREQHKYGVTHERARERKMCVVLRSVLSLCTYARVIGCSFSFIQDMHGGWERVSIIIAIIYCPWCILSHFSCTYFHGHKLWYFSLIFSLSRSLTRTHSRHSGVLLALDKNLTYENKNQFW